MNEFEYLKREYKRLRFFHANGAITGGEIFDLIYCLSAIDIFESARVQESSSAHYILKQAISLDLPWELTIQTLRRGL